MVKIGFGIKKTLQNTIIFATILMKYSQQYDYSSLFFVFIQRDKKICIHSYQKMEESLVY